MKNYKKDAKGSNNNKKIGININKILNKFVVLNLILIKYIYSNSNTIVHLIINGIGNQKILSNDFEQPQEIYVNGKIQNYTEYYNLTESENNMTMKWNIQLTSILNIFSNLNTITKIDISNANLSTINFSTICGISEIIKFK